MEVRRNIDFWLLASCFLLLPFSTGIESSLVFSYCIPFLIVTILVYSLQFIRHPFRRIQGIRVVILVMLALMIGVFVVFYSITAPEPLKSLWRAITQTIGIFVMIYMVIGPGKTTVNIIDLTKILSMFGIILSVYYIVNFIYKSFVLGFQTVLSERFVNGAASLPWGASNDIAAIIFLCLMGTLLSYKLFRDNWRLYICIIMFIAIFLTFSRTVIILSLIYLITYVITTVNLRTILSSVFISIIPWYLYKYLSESQNQVIQNFVLDRSSTSSISSFNSRADIWRIFLNYYQQDSTPIGYYSSLYTFGFSGHSVWLTTLIEQGILAFIVNVIFVAFLVFYITICFFNRYINFTTFILIISSVILIYINLSFEDANFTLQYNLTFWLYVAVLSRLSLGEVK